MITNVEDIYTSVACNKSPESADWGTNGLICFAASHALAFFDPKYEGSAKIIKTYVKHKKNINTIKWVKVNGKDTHCITGSDDGTAILWNLNDLENPETITLVGHSSVVNVVSGICVNGKFTLCTASTDSTIKLWQYEESGFRCFQTINLKGGFCFALSMTTLPNTNQILLAYSGDNENISLLIETFEEETRKFIPVHTFVGHEDWVRCLDFVVDEGDLILASSSQDHYVRLWRISARTDQEYKTNNVNILEVEEGVIRMEESIFRIKSLKDENFLSFAASLESVLHGHEGWVYGIDWHRGAELQLLSSSIDKTMIIWARDADTGVWMEKVRVGGVGGNLPGFYGGKFNEGGKAIFGHGFQGSFHIWRKSEKDESSWIPQVIIGGHFNEVRDICWEPEGQFLLSVSADATTRIHAPWIRNEKYVTWHEIARPQIHGYDMMCITSLSMQKFASGAEEKIIRVFQAPANFIENFHRISGTKPTEIKKDLQNIPKGASVPSLGLSNKAVYEVEVVSAPRRVRDEYPENYFVDVELKAPPEEEILMQNTLWPEEQKLYGHGFEIYTICSRPDGKILASACKSQTAEHAQIIIWDTSTWRIIKKLQAHKLTITQMKFSPDGKYLLSVSRDRKWNLFENDLNELGVFNAVGSSSQENQIHMRIIWSCDWSHDSKIFVTTSRDGKAVAWHRDGPNYENGFQSWKPIDTLNLPKESITAVAFATKFLEDSTCKYLIAIGCENGGISVYSFIQRWELILDVPDRLCHHLTVQKLQFRPSQEDFQLASCGSDNFIRILKLCV